MARLTKTEFIDLGRTFNELRVDPEGGDDGELRPTLFERDVIGWNALLAEHRVILLAPAGAGKTVEIRAAAKRLRDAGKSAFFLRIEHIARQFEAAFEVGDLAAFEAWTASGEEGWLLLDSVDEARLGSPRDFELAMRVLALRTRDAMQRAHILITSRTSAWRPKTDLLLAKSLFPFEPPLTASQDGEAADVAPAKGHSSFARPFRIFELKALTSQQIERFLVAREVKDAPGFLDAVERANAWSFTARPQDLEELAGFWNAEHRIGTRLEIMRSSIDRRLTERDPDRAQAAPLSAARAREGARLVAAASTFTGLSRVSIPDDVEHGMSLSIRKVLGGWTEAECATLAARPIFDGEIYGTVRFHHRSVREYLTAEWIASLLTRQGSRRRIQSLFFREQYGIPVVIPTTRAILPWLAILDDQIRSRVLELAPEITFEGGDPAQLPAETRRLVLSQVCEQLAQPAHGRSPLDYEAVQRFAGADIVEEIQILLKRYAKDDDIVWFLLRLISHGELKAAAADARHFALTSREHYARSAALKAVRTVGPLDDLREIGDAILAEPEPLRREWLAELIQGLPRDEPAIRWLGSALARVEPAERFSSDGLGEVLGEYIDALPAALAVILTETMSELLSRPPLLERRHCRISKRYQWLAQFSSRSIGRLIEERHPAATSDMALALLHQVPLGRDYHDLDMDHARSDLFQLVRSWPDLNHNLFWYCVGEARRERGNEPIVEYWRISMFGSAWGFAPSDFERILGDVTDRPLADDRRVALSLAFALYVEAGRPRAWRDRMKRAAAADPVLAEDLAKLLHPPASGRQAWRTEERSWKQKRRRAEQQELKEAARTRVWMRENLGKVWGDAKSDQPTAAQMYLLNRMGKSDESRHVWTDGRWERLIVEFGEEVARTFRDGAVAFWRRSLPPLLSEGGSAGSTPSASILGLCGLAIEARETPDLATRLTQEEARIAVRYALEELNGFPPWLPAIYERYPDPVIAIILAEIGHELAEDTAERSSHYLLYDASWSGQWMWDRLGPALLAEDLPRPRSLGNLNYILTIVTGSPVGDSDLAAAAARSAARASDPAHKAVWFAAWVGVEPDAALDAFDTFLSSLPDNPARTQAVMVFATHLLGTRRAGGATRGAFRTVATLKRLFLLVHTHVRSRDDIERAGKGVYSPTLRDDAQDARDSIFAMLRAIPGKEAYLALMELARLHPDNDARPWMAFHARTKAEQDADSKPWTTDQFIEFNDALERSPSTHHELWELAISRLLDLKHDLERSDTSVAKTLLRIPDEEELRNFIANWCRERAAGRYSIPQEEELADAKRTDLRFHGAGFDAPVPIELKIADNWTGPRLLERLENQLCGDYLRDPRSTRGIYLLVYSGGPRSRWEVSVDRKAHSFDDLVEALQDRWQEMATLYADIEDVRVIGIDLTKRSTRPSRTPP